MLLQLRIHLIPWLRAGSEYARTKWRRFRISASSPLLDGYDEPEILRSSIPQICLSSADGGHYAVPGMLKPAWARDRARRRARASRPGLPYGGGERGEPSIVTVR